MGGDFAFSERENIPVGAPSGVLRANAKGRIFPGDEPAAFHFFLSLRIVASGFAAYFMKADGLIDYDGNTFVLKK